MRIRALKTVRLDGSKKPSAAVAKLMKEHGRTVFFAFGEYPDCPPKLAEALVKDGAAEEI